MHIDSFSIRVIASTQTQCFQSMAFSPTGNFGLSQVSRSEIGGGLVNRRLRSVGHGSRGRVYLSPAGSE